MAFFVKSAGSDLGFEVVGMLVFRVADNAPASADAVDCLWPVLDGNFEVLTVGGVPLLSCRVLACEVQDALRLSHPSPQILFYRNNS